MAQGKGKQCLQNIPFQVRESILHQFRDIVVKEFFVAHARFADSGRIIKRSLDGICRNQLEQAGQYFGLTFEAWVKKKKSLAFSWKSRRLQLFEKSDYLPLL